MSALHLAAEGNHTACMELLLMAGANVDLKNRVRASVLSVRSRKPSAVSDSPWLHGAVWLDSSPPQR